VSTGPRDGETELRETRYELLDWLVGHAVTLEYADNAASYGESAGAAAAAAADGAGEGAKALVHPTMHISKDELAHVILC
jgi:hypothetical protein